MSETERERGEQASGLGLGSQGADNRPVVTDLKALEVQFLNEFGPQLQCKSCKKVGGSWAKQGGPRLQLGCRNVLEGGQVCGVKNSLHVQLGEALLTAVEAEKGEEMQIIQEALDKLTTAFQATKDTNLSSKKGKKGTGTAEFVAPRTPISARNERNSPKMNTPATQVVGGESEDTAMEGAEDEGRNRKRGRMDRTPTNEATPAGKFRKVQVSTPTLAPNEEEEGDTGTVRNMELTSEESSDVGEYDDEEDRERDWEKEERENIGEAETSGEEKCEDCEEPARQCNGCGAMKCGTVFISGGKGLIPRVRNYGFKVRGRDREKAHFHYGEGVRTL